MIFNFMAEPTQSSLFRFVRACWNARASRSSRSDDFPSVTSKLDGRPSRRSLTNCRSAAGFRFRNVPFHAVEIDAVNCADEAAPPIINVNQRNRANIEFRGHGWPPPDDVDLAQRYFRIALRHLLQAR